MTKFEELIKFFGSRRSLDQALARSFLGYRIRNIPEHWDWNEIQDSFHMPVKTLSLLMSIHLKNHGIDVEEELSR